MNTILVFITRLVDRYGIGFFVYLGVAIVSALSEWTSFIASLPATGPIAAAVIGFFFGTLVNFVLSHRFAFRSARPVGQEFFLVAIVSGVAFSANFLAYFVLFSYFGVNVLIAKIVGTGCGFSFNYLARQFYVFSLQSPFASISSTFRQRRLRAASDSLVARLPDGGHSNSETS
jgi:putative flippase GtrA